jgi:hypothetical protein
MFRIFFLVVCFAGALVSIDARPALAERRVTFFKIPDRYERAFTMMKEGDCLGGIKELWGLAARRDYDALLFVVETTTRGGVYYKPHGQVPDIHPLRGVTNTFPSTMVPLFIYSTLAKGVIDGRRDSVGGENMLRQARWLLGEFRVDLQARRVMECFGSVIKESRERKWTDDNFRVEGASQCVKLAESEGVIPTYDRFVQEQLTLLESADEPVDCEIPHDAWYQRITQ